VISRFALARGEGGSRRGAIVGQDEARPGDSDAVIAEFIRTRGITRCPTACVLPTQGSIDAADRAALEQHAMTLERSRQTKAAARARLFWAPASPPQRGK
jgi:hypothetical protein